LIVISRALKADSPITDLLITDYFPSTTAHLSPTTAVLGLIRERP
jgi:hypothetical protein